MTADIYKKRLRSRSAVNESGCWIWSGCKNKFGYGTVRISGKTMLAHRASYALLVGDFDKNLTIDHLCRNRACINPEHLEPVTRAENTRRVPKKTKCKRGHSLDINSGNVIVRHGKVKQCRICVNEGQLRSYYRRKQAREAAHEAQG